MKTTKALLTTLCLTSIMLSSCKQAPTIYDQIRQEMTDKNATDETVALFCNLKKIASEGKTLFGHQAATEYGRGWYGDADRSDVKEVCGSHPAVSGNDFGGFTGINQTPEEIQKEKERLGNVIRETYNRGGVTSICWHVNNPVSGGSFYWSDSPVEAVSEIIPGGSHHETYKEILARIADFANNLRGDDGKPVPMIFRPWHEFDGEWFWWGVNHCTPEEFVELWRFTVSYLRDELGVHTFIYAYSPDCRFNNEAEYLSRYPGDEWVDMVGVDNYADFGRDKGNSLEAGIRKLQVVSEYARQHNKIAAFTETGLESIPDTTWWTNTLLKALTSEGVEMAYALVWRNDSRSETHYYAPHVGHPSTDNFMEFYRNPGIVFEKDLKNVYRIGKKKH